MNTHLNLAGIGIGPFNLSLAALLEKVPSVQSRFFEQKSEFSWHSEVMFHDSYMQTSYLKDLVTPVDPTNPYSFLNFLSQNGLFYAFINTQRTTASRREFEQYCQWASEGLAKKLQFDTSVKSVSFENEKFQIETSKGSFTSDHLCIGTGLTPRIPTCAIPYLGAQVLHAKSDQLKSVQLEGKRVVIVGGGQTGIEVFRNALHSKWGRPASLKLVTRRQSLEPLDESAFTNEYFTPNYAHQFWDLGLEQKSRVVASQKLASDGNTPAYLLNLFNDLYLMKHIEKDDRDIRIHACRKLTQIQKQDASYSMTLENTFIGKNEEMVADVIILCTGFESILPKVIEPLMPMLKLDAEKRLTFKKSYAIEWQGSEKNKIYALNFSRHHHGIIDPQTSLMAWRSANVINDLTQKNIYTLEQAQPNFVDYGTVSK